MKIKKIKLKNEYVYPVTIAAAIKDSNFLDSNSKAMTLGAINEYLDNKQNTISKSNYKNYIGLASTNPDYNKTLFLDDGSGIIFQGKLYINSPYWIKLVDALPETEEENTIYLVKQND